MLCVSEQTAGLEIDLQKALSNLSHVCVYFSHLGQIIARRYSLGAVPGNRAWRLQDVAD